MQKALKGVDSLINTMGTEGDFAVAKRNLVEAAAEVGVKLYFPWYMFGLARLSVVNGGLILMLIRGLSDTRSGMERKRMMHMLLR